MSTDEFQEIWKAYDRKLEKSLQLNLHLLKEVQSQKARSALRSFIAGRVIGIVIGMLYLVLLGFAFWWVRTQPVMAVSFAVFIICTVIAIGEYIQEIGVIPKDELRGQYCRYASETGGYSEWDRPDAPHLLAAASLLGDLFCQQRAATKRGQGVFYVRGSDCPCFGDTRDHFI